MTTTKITQRLLPYFLSTALLILLFSVHIHFFYPHLFFADDPYIVLHSAQVLQQGYDPNYPTTPALVGNSSPVHLLLTYLLLFFFSPLYALICTNWLAIIAYTWGLIYLSRLYRCNTWQIIVIIFCGLFSGTCIAQLLNGLETSLVMAAITWALILARLPLCRSNRYCFMILLGTLPFIRPELLALSGTLTLFQLYRYQQNHGLKITTIIQDVMLIGLAASPWLFWLWHTTQHFYPETITAKATFFARDYPNIFDRCKMFCFVLLRFFSAISALYLISLYLLSKQKLGQAILLFLFIFSMAYLCTEPSILRQNNFHYLYPFIPLLLFGFISTMQAPQKILSYTAQLTVALIALITLCILPLQYIYYHYTALQTGLLQERYATWCNAHLPKNESIAIQDAGFIAYATPLLLTDFVGLKSPENILLHKHYTKPSHGLLRAQAISLILQSKKAHYLIMTNEWVDEFKIPKQLQALGWQVKLLKAISIEMPKGATLGYLIYYINPPPRYSWRGSIVA